MNQKEKAPSGIGAKEKTTNELYQKIMLKEILRKDWIKSYQILDRIGYSMTSRSFRKWVSDFNQTFDGKTQKEYIVHSSKGYKMTSNVDEIKRSTQDNFRRAITMLKQIYRTRKQLGMKDQISIFEIIEEEERA